MNSLHIFFSGTVWVGLLAGQALYAANEDIANRYSLVGVIASSKDQNKSKEIAVLKDNQASHSVFLAIGDRLRGYPSFKVVGIDQKKVLVSNGQGQVALTRESFPDEGAGGGPAFTDTSYGEQAPYDMDDMPPPGAGAYGQGMDARGNYPGGGYPPPPPPPPGYGQGMPPIDELPPPPPDYSFDELDEPLPPPGDSGGVPFRWDSGDNGSLGNQGWNGH